MTFDYPRFYAELDRIRQERKLTWYGIFRQTGITAFHSKATFLTKPVALHPRTRAEICAWAGLDANDFIVESAVGA